MVCVPNDILEVDRHMKWEKEKVPVSDIMLRIGDFFIRQNYLQKRCNIVHNIVITSDIGVVSIAAEYIVFIWSQFFRTLFLWGFTVASHYGEKSSGGSTAPSGSGIERCDQAYLFGYFRQPFHVIISFFTL